MAEPQKTRLNAKEILRDIQSGMSNADLKTAYGLSDKGLQSLYAKLAAKGLLSPEEAAARGDAGTGPPERRAGKPDTGGWRCPACNATQATPVEECPACGVIVAKFEASRDRDRQVSQHIVMQSKTGLPAWIAIAAGVAVTIFIVAGGYHLFMPEKRSATKPPKVAAVKPSTTFRLIDTGGTKIIMEYVPNGFPLGLSVSEGRLGHFFESPGLDQRYGRMPQDTQTKRFYDDFTIAGEKFLIITEASSPPRMFLDANRNGDMTDDPGPFEAEGSGLLPNHFTLTLPYLLEKVTAPYRLWAFPSRMGGVRFYPQCHWRGELVIGEVVYPLVLFDGNSDGDYSNDPMVIDVNQDGKASSEEMLRPGQSLSVNEIPVKLISIAPSGRWARLEM